MTNSARTGTRQLVHRDEPRQAGEPVRHHTKSRFLPVEIHLNVRDEATKPLGLSGTLPHSLLATLSDTSKAFRGNWEHPQFPKRQHVLITSRHMIRQNSDSLKNTTLTRSRVYQ